MLESEIIEKNYRRHEFKFHNFNYEIDVGDKDIVVWTPYGNLGYQFLLQNNLVDWNQYPEHAALIPEEVMQHVESLVQK